MPDGYIKTSEEIKIMAEGGKLLGRILKDALRKAEPGLSTLEIDGWIDKGIASAGGAPSFKLVPRYLWASCTGLNDEIVHSIPKKDRIIKEGDLLKIDLGMLWKGFHTDLAWTVVVGNKAKKQPASTQRGEQSNKERFLEAGQKALEEAKKVAKAGNRVGHISQKIQEIIETAGYHPVEVLTGHGIGRRLHEDPLIPGVLKGSLEKTPILREGMTIAIEIIYNQGRGEAVLGNDGWTVSSKDGKISGLFENTIAVTDREPLILAGGFLC